jgi:diguanylate cyclase (GGDEF)-like protein/PAS domain S-box-containing protein
MTILGRKILKKVKKSMESGVLKNEYKMLFTHFPGACMVCDFDGFIIEANQPFYSLMKYDKEEMANKSVFSFMKFKQADIGTVYLNNLMNGNTVTLVSDLITGSGQINDMEVTLIPIIKNNELVGMFLVILDGGEKTQLKQDLTRLEETLSYEQQLARIGSWTYDIKRNETHISEGICQVLGCTPHQFDGNLETLYSNVHVNDIDAVKEAIQNALKGKEYDIEYRVMTPGGTEKYVHEKTKVLRDEDQNPVKIIGITQEINCYIDEFTKLPNRAYFMRQIKSQTGEARANNLSFALVMLNIDGFEYINDALGYQVGDQLIIQVSKRLKNFLGNDKFLCRYSEDQFAIIATGFNDIIEYGNFAREIIDLFSHSIKVNKHELNISVCMGISIYPDDGLDAGMLEKNANIALLRSKNQGKNRYLFHSSDMRMENYRQFVLRNDLCKAIEKLQLKVYYQPQVNLKTNEIFAAEALVRWEHPYLGLVPPNEFIYIAEENYTKSLEWNWIIQSFRNMSLHKISRQKWGWIYVTYTTSLKAIPIKNPH